MGRQFLWRFPVRPKFSKTGNVKKRTVSAWSVGAAMTAAGTTTAEEVRVTGMGTVTLIGTEVETGAVTETGKGTGIMAGIRTGTGTGVVAGIGVATGTGTGIVTGTGTVVMTETRTRVMAERGGAVAIVTVMNGRVGGTRAHMLSTRMPESLMQCRII